MGVALAKGNNVEEAREKALHKLLAKSKLFKNMFPAFLPSQVQLLKENAAIALAKSIQRKLI